jgi:hypothetical protein
VVIVTGDGSGNTSSPADDPGFANIAKRDNATAIYLGNRWVLTAWHVGAGATILNDAPFEVETASTDRLTNPDGPAEETDIILYRLVEDPNLPSLRLGCRTPDVGATVLMAGQGGNRAPELTYWNVTPVEPGDNNDVWEPVGPPPPAADHAGYLTAGGREIRWGQNRIDSVNSKIDSGFGQVLSFQTKFDELGVADEAQAVTGDSGGPVFQKRGSTWELVGMIFSVDLFDNQPGLSASALFNNVTYIADLALYEAQIRAIADFDTSAPGDFDRDGELTALDVDLLTAEIRGDGSACHFDLTGDGKVDAADVNFWVEEAKETSFGDANLDGHVAFADFVVLADHFQQLGGWGDGDFDGDGMIAFFDFVVLSDNFGSSPTSGTSPVQSVPEPGPLLPVVAGFVLVGVALRRRTSGSQ